MNRIKQKNYDNLHRKNICQTRENGEAQFLANQMWKEKIQKTKQKNK